MLAFIGSLVVIVVAAFAFDVLRFEHKHDTKRKLHTFTITEGKRWPFKDLG